MWLVCCAILALGCLGNTYVDAQLNDVCRTPEGQSGTCISINDCPPLLAMLTKNRGDPKTVAYLRKVQCGFLKDPLVCCTTQTNKPQTGGTTTFSTRSNNVLPTRKTCGIQQYNDKILLGEVTELDEFPWMVLLDYKQPNGSFTFACGGSLISDRYVLTAGHCVKGSILQTVGSLERVILGEHNTDTKEDCITRDDFKVCNNPPTVVNVEKIIPHPEYSPDSNNREHDIALVRLAQKVKYTDFIKPICLPLPDEQATESSKLFVSGWGKTENASYSSVKLKLKVPFVPSEKCFRTFSRARVQLTERQMCAGGEANKDSCNGDSGGPLMNTAKNDIAQWYVEGIVSFGTTCGTKGWPGVYTKVSKYMDWIYQNVEA